METLSQQNNALTPISYASHSLELLLSPMEQNSYQRGLAVSLFSVLSKIASELSSTPPNKGLALDGIPMALQLFELLLLSLPLKGLRESDCALASYILSCLQSARMALRGDVPAQASPDTPLGALPSLEGCKLTLTERSVLIVVPDTDTYWRLVRDYQKALALVVAGIGNNYRMRLLNPGGANVVLEPDSYLGFERAVSYLNADTRSAILQGLQPLPCLQGLRVNFVYCAEHGLMLAIHSSDPCRLRGAIEHRQAIEAVVLERVPFLYISMFLDGRVFLCPWKAMEERR